MQLTILVTRREDGRDYSYNQAEAVVDEGVLEENPSWWLDKVKEVLSSDDGNIASHAFVTVNVDDDALDEALKPDRFVSAATVTAILKD